MPNESNSEKTDLTPKRRFMANLVGGRQGKRISVSNPTSIACVELMNKSGIHFPGAHLDAGVDSIGPECAISLETPIANLEAIVSAAEDGY